MGLVIVGYFHFMRVLAFPPETDAVFVVYSDTMLAEPIALQA
jgi:hypothetical protein